MSGGEDRRYGAQEIDLVSTGLMTLSEPEFVGKISTRTELTILPAGDAKAINFTVTTYCGCEVSTVSEGGSEPHVIKDYEGLRDGMLVEAWGIHFRVEPTLGGFTGYSPRREVMYLLSYNEDDRHCWACTGIINLKGLMQLDLMK